MIGIERRSWSPWIALMLMAFVCLSIWQIIGCPGPPPSPTASASASAFASASTNPFIIQLQTDTYTLLTEENTSSSLVEFTEQLNQLPSDDYSRLVDLNNFQFTILSHVCGHQHHYHHQQQQQQQQQNHTLLLLVLVHSAPGNILKREAIRKTWGTFSTTSSSSSSSSSMTSAPFRVVFLLGSVIDSQQQKLLTQEQHRYGDLVQGNFHDAYRNMTYKHVMALKYALYMCPEARYILKTDDDVFVNMPTMLSFLNSDLSPWGARRLLFCQVLWQSYPKRSFRSKWRVSFHEYPYNQYPPYCPGWALLYSPDVAFAIYREAQRSRYFWIDDVLLTGILAAELHINHTQLASSMILTPHIMSQFINTNINVINNNNNNEIFNIHNATSNNINTSGTSGNIANINANMASQFLFGPPDMRPKDIRALWNAIHLN